MPWVLMYSEKFPTKLEAVRREMEIKKRKDRRYIEKLIAQLVQGIPAE
jgi:putative endonuclease